MDRLDFFFIEVDLSIFVKLHVIYLIHCEKIGNILPNIVPIVNPPICWVMFCPLFLVN